MGLSSSEAYNTKHIPILLFCGAWIMLTLEAFQITQDADAFQVTLYTF
jgi:hypothetical protein